MPLRKWALTYDVVLRDDREYVVTASLTGEQTAPNIINACERMRRAVENDDDLRPQNGQPVSADVVSCTLLTDTAIEPVAEEGAAEDTL
jgi:hypothetical protein